MVVTTTIHGGNHKRKQSIHGEYNTWWSSQAKAIHRISNHNTWSSQAKAIHRISNHNTWWSSQAKALHGITAITIHGAEGTTTNSIRVTGTISSELVQHVPVVLKSIATRSTFQPRSPGNLQCRGGGGSLAHSATMPRPIAWRHTCLTRTVRGPIRRAKTEHLLIRRCSRSSQ